MKDLSGVNICVLNWNTQVLLKIWLAYPLFCCTLCFWYLSAMIVFLTREQMALQMGLWRIIWN